MGLAPGHALQEMSRLLTSAGEVIIAHLMSRKELAAHHGAHISVARDVLSEASEMKGLFAQAGLSSPDMVDIPGRYTAGGVKKP